MSPVAAATKPEAKLTESLTIRYQKNATKIAWRFFVES